MYRLTVSFLLACSLSFAATPLPYSNLGDKIYNSTGLYKKLMPELPHLKSKIETYLQHVKTIKAMGFEAEMNNASDKDYLKELRKLEHERESILVSINADLYNAMDANKATLFQTLILSGLVDLDKVGDDVIPFYKQHFKKGSIGVLDEMLHEQERYRNSARKMHVDYAKQVEMRRISRMRAASEEIDTRKQEELDAAIEAEKERVEKTLETEIIR
jgi:hypothetical protein